MSKLTYSNQSSSIFVSFLTVMFIELKLTEKIDWSWWWVLSPMWISAVVAIVLVGLVTLVTKN